MKIVYASTLRWWRLPRRLIALGGVLLTPFAATAQEAPDEGAAAEASPAPNEAAAPENSDAGAAEPEAEAVALEATPAPQSPAAGDVERGSIVVTGYRKSLKAALSQKETKHRSSGRHRRGGHGRVPRF